MSRNSTALLIVASVVIVGAFVFFNNSKDQSPTDLTGAIGTVDKYRSEQITPSDVVTSTDTPNVDIWAQFEAGHLTFEELGNALARIPAQDRMKLYQRLTPETAAKAIANAPEAERAVVGGRATAEETVAIIGRMTVGERNEFLGKIGMDAAAFERGTVGDRIKMVDERIRLTDERTRLTDERLTGGLAVIYQRALPEERINMMSRIEIQGRYDLFERSLVGGRGTVGQLDRGTVETEKSKR